MGEQEIAMRALAETTKSYVKVKFNDNNNNNNEKKSNENERQDLKGERRTLLRRLPSILTPNFGKLKMGFHGMSCVKKEDDDELDEEETPMLYTRKSIDINITEGFARRASLFLFTRKQVCVHPYHPYTPKQTTRRIYIGTEEH